MKRGETLGGVLRVGNVVLLKLGKVSEEVINMGVLWRWRLGGIRELDIHEKVKHWPVVEIRRVVSGGDVRLILEGLDGS